MHRAAAFLVAVVALLVPWCRASPQHSTGRADCRQGAPQSPHLRLRGGGSWTQLLRGGGERSGDTGSGTLNVAAQFQGFLEAVTFCADSVLRGVPTAIGAKLPFVVGIVRQFSSYAVLGAVEGRGSLTPPPGKLAPPRYLPSTVQITRPAPPTFYKRGRTPAAAFVAPPLHLQAAHLPAQVGQQPEQQGEAAAEVAPAGAAPVENVTAVAAAAPAEDTARDGHPPAGEAASPSSPPPLDLKGGGGDEQAGVKETPAEAAQMAPEVPVPVASPATQPSPAVTVAAVAASPASPPAFPPASPPASPPAASTAASTAAPPAAPPKSAAPAAAPPKVSQFLRVTSEDMISLMATLESRLQLLSQWKVMFMTRVDVAFGDALFVCGDSDTLGSWDPNKAIRLMHEGRGLWRAAVEDIPDGSRYKYLVQKHDPDARCGEPTWLTSYPLELSSTMEQCMLNEGYLVQDDTKVDVRFKVRKDAEQVWVTGSCEALGEWDETKAVKLERTENGDGWEGVATIASDDLFSFQYKFFCIPRPNEPLSEGSKYAYECGANRGSDCSLVEPQQDGSSFKRVINLQCVWEGLLIRFMIFHPLDKPESVLAASGGLPAMGGWLGAPLKMGLGNERTLLTGVKGKCWEATFPAGDDDFGDMQYRYCIIDGKTKTAIFEREPNRRIHMIPGRLSGACIKAPTLGIGERFVANSGTTALGKSERGIRQREWQTFDGNFVPPDLSFDHVPPSLAIGPYPQSQADVDLMKEEGITGVLNVQTDDDHKRRMIDWATMEKLYAEAGIDVIRVPIEDFHGGELEKLVFKGAQAVDDMINRARERGAQPKVYIHCTAGMGRAPAVACIWMVWREGYSLQDALAKVKKHRTVAAPNWHAMEAALRHGGL